MVTHRLVESTLKRDYKDSWVAMYGTARMCDDVFSSVMHYVKIHLMLSEFPSY